MVHCSYYMDTCFDILYQLHFETYLNLSSASIIPGMPIEVQNAGMIKSSKMTVTCEWKCNMTSTSHPRNKNKPIECLCWLQNISELCGGCVNYMPGERRVVHPAISIFILYEHFAHDIVLRCNAQSQFESTSRGPLNVTLSNILLH